MELKSLKKDSTLKTLVIVACLFIIVGGMKIAANILNPFFLAIFISIVASQPVNWLINKGVRKSISIVIVMLLIITFGILVGGLIGGSIAQFTQNLPKLDKNFTDAFKNLILQLNDIGINVSDEKILKAIDPGKIMGFTASTINGMGNILGQTMIITFIVLFILFELESFPTKYKIITVYEKSPHVYNFEMIIHNVRSYLGIKTLTSLATGIIIAFSLKLIGIQYAFFWGLIAFLMNYIPNIGSLLAAIPALLFAIIENGLGDTLWTAGVYVAVNTIIGSILEPKIMGDGLGLSTLVVLLSLLFWGWVFGPIGMFLSVPFTMSLKIILETSDSSKWLSVILDSEDNTKKQWRDMIEERDKDD